MANLAFGQTCWEHKFERRFRPTTDDKHTGHKVRRLHAYHTESTESKPLDDQDNVCRSTSLKGDLGQPQMINRHKVRVVFLPIKQKVQSRNL
jgi:hypothetical protein